MSIGENTQEIIYDIYLSGINDSFKKVHKRYDDSKAAKHKNSAIYSKLVQALDDAFGVEYD